MLSELNAMAAVSVHRNFRRAAAELDVSPSALSHSIAALEKRLGVRLFNRTTRSVALTTAGERFLARVSPALREISQAIDAVNEFRDSLAGTLKINCAERAAREIFAPVVLEFLRRHPEMKVDLVTEGRLIDIVEKGFDAGIRLAETVPQDMIAVPCGPPTRWVTVASPDYLARRGKPYHPRDLATHNCVRRRLPGGSLYRWEFERAGDETVLDVPGALTLDNDALMIEAAIEGLGIAYVSESGVRRELADGRLAAVLEDWTPPFPGLCLYYPGNRHVPAGLKALIALLRERNRQAHA
jgi:DNA-binding transcriptional LysR family regulator